MENKTQSIINIPSFLFQIYNPSKVSFLKKIFLIVFGKVVQFFYKYTKNRTFCYFMNILLPKYSKISFNDGFYFKTILENHKIYYPNKRITRVIGANNQIFKKLFETYCLDKIEFNDGDIVIDCGANIGELNYSFYLNGLSVQYIAFEPDSESFQCLIKNKITGNELHYKYALSNTIGEQKFFLDSYGGNSSIVFFGSKKYEIVKTTTLDSLNLHEKIKLFKLEAEGYEPEVIEGSLNTLKIIEYVSVDFGAERGVTGENTVIAVNNLLINNNFELIDFSNYRMVGLYKNKTLR